MQETQVGDYEYSVQAHTAMHIVPLRGMPEISSGDNIAELILKQVQIGHCEFPCLQDGDIIIVTSKIVSKSEGRLVEASRRNEAIAAETVRVVASRGETRIVETRHGFVMAAAGVDASNTAQGTALLLPVDPDASARQIRKELERHSGRNVAVVISDTVGRPWRSGLVDIALGAAGITPALDYRGRTDSFGNSLEITVTAIVDEIAAAADLVKGKLSGTPVAILRGMEALVSRHDGPGVRALIRDAAEDLFRQGSLE